MMMIRARARRRLLPAPLLLLFWAIFASPCAAQNETLLTLSGTSPSVTFSVAPSSTVSTVYSVSGLSAGVYPAFSLRASPVSEGAAACAQTTMYRRLSCAPQTCATAVTTGADVTRVLQNGWYDFVYPTIQSNASSRGSATCKCNNVTHTDELLFYSFRNTGASACTVSATLGVGAANVCSGRGYISTATGTCKCFSDLVGGFFCEQDNVPITPVGSTWSPELTSVPGSKVFFEFAHDNENEPPTAASPSTIVRTGVNPVRAFAIALEVTSPVESLCAANTLAVNVEIYCGYPSTCGSVRPTTTGSLSFVGSQSLQYPKSRYITFTKLTERTGCGCATNTATGNRNSTWVVSVAQSAWNAETCKFRAKVQPLCGTGIMDPTSQRCKCPFNTAGSYCELVPTLLTFPSTITFSGLGYDPTRSLYYFPITDAGILSLSVTNITTVPPQTGAQPNPCQSLLRFNAIRTCNDITFGDNCRSRLDVSTTATKSFPLKYTPSTYELACNCPSANLTTGYASVTFAAIGTYACAATLQTSIDDPCNYKGKYSFATDSCNCTEAGWTGPTCSQYVVGEKFTRDNSTGKLSSLTRTSVNPKQTTMFSATSRDFGSPAATNTSSGTNATSSSSSSSSNNSSSTTTASILSFARPVIVTRVITAVSVRRSGRTELVVSPMGNTAEGTDSDDAVSFNRARFAGLQTPSTAASACLGLKASLVAVCSSTCDVANFLAQYPNRAATATFDPINQGITVTAGLNYWSQGCECSSTSGELSPASWVTVIENTATSGAACNFEMQGKIEFVCPTSLRTGLTCSGNGVCSPDSQCICKEETEGYNCDSSQSDYSQIFNRRKYGPLAVSATGVPSRIYFPAGATNSMFTVYFGNPTSQFPITVIIRREDPIPSDFRVVYQSTSSLSGGTYAYLGTNYETQIVIPPNNPLDNNGHSAFNWTDTRRGKTKYYMMAFVNSTELNVASAATIGPSLEAYLEISDTIGTIVDISLLSLLGLLLVGGFIYYARSKPSQSDISEDAWRKNRKMIEEQRKEYKEKLEKFDTELKAWQERQKNRPPVPAGFRRSKKKKGGFFQKSDSNGSLQPLKSQQSQSRTDLAPPPPLPPLFPTPSQQQQQPLQPPPPLPPLNPYPAAANNSNNTPPALPPKAGKDAGDKPAAGGGGGDAMVTPFDADAEQHIDDIESEKQRLEKEKKAKDAQNADSAFGTAIAETARVATTASVLGYGPNSDTAAHKAASAGSGAGAKMREMNEAPRPDLGFVPFLGGGGGSSSSDSDDFDDDDWDPNDPKPRPPRVPAALRQEYSSKPGKAGKKTGISFVGYIVAFILMLFSFAFNALRVLFNIGLIHSSLTSLLPLIKFDFTVLRPEVDVLDSLMVILGPVGKAVTAVAKVLRNLDFIAVLLQGWNCGGASVILVPYIVLLITVLLNKILKKDFLLVLSISINTFKIGASVIKKLLITAASKLLTILTLYVIQIVLVVNHRMVTAIFASKTSCSYVDFLAFRYAQVAVIICLVMLVVINFYNFAGGGRSYSGKDKCGIFLANIFGMITGAFRILLLTLGIWNTSTITAHAIAFRAEKFDDDEGDDDNQHERVISITGASRGLIWMAVPFTIILAKVAEATNSPPVIVFGNSLQFKRSLKMRLVLYLSHVIQLVLIVGLLFSANLIWVYLLPVTLLPPLIIHFLEDVGRA